MQQIRFGRVQEPSALECLRVNIVAEALSVAAVIKCGIVSLETACPERHAAVIVRVEAGARDDIEDAAEAVAELRRESAGDHVDRWDHIGREAWRKQLVRVVEKRPPFNKRIKREF